MQHAIETYQVIAEYADDCILVIDTDFRIRYVNPAAVAAFGYTAEEMTGRLLYEVIRPHAPDGKPVTMSDSPLSRVYQEKRALRDHAMLFFSRNGIPLTMSCSCSPVIIAGELRGAVMLARDISERIRAEQALQESEQRFRLLADAMPQIVWTTTAEGTVNYLNARFAEYTGLPAAVGADYVSPMHPEDLPKRKLAQENALRNGSDYKLEHRMWTADGNYRWFLSHGIPLKNADGEVLGWYGTSTDIDDMRHTLDELRDSRETLRLAAEATNLGLWDYRPLTKELLWDEANRRLFGVPMDKAISYAEFLECVHSQDRERVDRAAQLAMAPHSDGRFDQEFRINRQNDGQERWLRAYGKTLRGDNGQANRFLGTSIDITDVKLAEMRVREASQHDALTGLPNRALLMEYCNHLLAMAQRTNNHAAILFIDLDRFKPINDNHGHHVGDQVLKQVAKRLTECTREEDIVGRLGGDEFLVAIRHADDTGAPSTVARHIIDKISAPYHVGQLQLHLSPSIGISLYPQHGANLDSLINQADAAMYSAKKSGRKTYKFYAPESAGGDSAELSIEMRLKYALENNELVLHYQPVVDLESRRVIGAEALLRLPLSKEIFLVPEQFMHIAESAGLITRLGDWVAREACRQHSQWQQAGLTPMSMSINIAPQQLRQSTFVSQLANSVEEHGMDPACLQIELQESTVLEDVQDAIVALQKIRALGIRVAIDDFGVGHSSVGLLSSLPLDKLKIDQSLVGGIGVSKSSQTITDTILALGKSLDLTVVGEGIESEAAFDYLREHGCHQAQGYYFSEPLAADDFERWCRSSQIAAAAH